MAWALAVLAVLVLLPGVLVVRAPWTAMPALSLAFWAASLWWPPLAGLPRGRALTAGLVVFGLLAVLRLLPKHEVPPPPGWRPTPRPDPPARPGLPPPRLAGRPSILVLLAALAVLLPALPCGNAPGRSMAFQTTCVRLLLWRDGIPLSAEPLLPLAPFGAHAPAIAGLAADLSSLSGIDPGRAVLLVFAAAVALALIGLFALEATWLPPVAAALACLSGAALFGWPGSLALWSTGEALLGLAFVLPAAALLLGHASRSSALAAGFLLGAALLAQPLLALAVWISAVVADGLGRRPRAPRLRRAAMACAAAAAVGGPGLVPTLRSLSWSELRAVLTSPTWAEAAGFLLLLLVSGVAAALSRRLAESRPGLVLPAAVAGAALLLVAIQLQLSRAQLPAQRRAALAALEANTRPLDVVCAPDDVRDWVPGLTGRAVGEPGPWIPPEYRDEWAGRSRESCLARR